jgi:hypothetical protein
MKTTTATNNHHTSSRWIVFPEAARMEMMTG